MIKIAVLSDIHYAGPAAGVDPDVPDREMRLSDIFLLRAVHRLNRMIRPDVTLLLGDLINDYTSPDAPELLAHLRKFTDKLESPVIALPGNHDLPPEQFYKVFEKPAEQVDLKGYRFITFCDQQEPNWQASRSEADLQRMRAAREGGFDGTVISLQHVPLFPPGMSESPYNYTNAESVIAAMRESGIDVALSGHYHAGMDVRSDALTFVAAPALCEPPYQFLEITIDGTEVNVTRHSLRLPAPGLYDLHVHTPLAYCSQNMSVPATLALADMFGLAGVVFTEHSGQLRFKVDTYWGNDFLDVGYEYSEGIDDRLDAYLALAAKHSLPPEQVGFEVDCDYQGRPVLSPKAPAGRFRLGSIHQLRNLRRDSINVEAACDELLMLAERFCRSGINVLAHPFRIFWKREVPAPDKLFARVVRLLLENSVAAEMNFHTNQPPPEFFRLCIEAGVKIAFGSDAHNLYEVGEFAPHLALLRDIGFNGDLQDILYQPKIAGGNK